jgi:hypothetical protein
VRKSNFIVHLGLGSGSYITGVVVIITADYVPVLTGGCAENVKAQSGGVIVLRSRGAAPENYYSRY